jgi:hypothetical protein
VASKAVGGRKLIGDSGINWLLIGIALSFLILGLLIFYSQLLTRARNFRAANTISWLLFAISAALIIIFFFPASSADGVIFGFSLGGAAALFGLVFFFGSKRASQANDMDELEVEHDKLKEECGALKSELEDFKKSGTSAVPAPRELLETETFNYELKKNKKRKISIITGDIGKVKVADVWVNSENTNMEMSRYYEKSVSAVIRYMGAE